MKQVNEEYFDVVNERDEVIGRELRANVHARKLWHRAVHVLVYDRTGKVFLQKRSHLKDTSPGCWDSSCSGHVDSGEHYDPAARRELMEEIGIDVAPPPRWFRIKACEQTGWEFVWVYRLTHEGPFTLNSQEIERGDWFVPAELTALIARDPQIFAPSFRLIWRISMEGPPPCGPK